MLINLLYIVIAILLLCFIILFHELGHYIAGRLCGIGIVEFAIGSGRKSHIGSARAFNTPFARCRWAASASSSAKTRPTPRRTR